MSDSTAAAVTQLAHALPPQAGNEAPTSSSLAQVEPFNTAAREAFVLYVESRREIARERVTATEKREWIGWLTERWTDKNLPEKQKKRRTWVKEDFFLEHGKLYRKATKRYEAREVVIEERIWDTIIAAHNNAGHTGQEATAKMVLLKYYGISRAEVLFLIKLCEICHRKAASKSKGPLKPIVSTRLFQRVQIDLVDMTATPDGSYVWICHMEDHFSKFHMLFPMKNKEAATVARCIHHWIAVLGIFEILQSDNGSEFKGICLELMARYGIKVINGRPRTPRTQGLVEQSNGTVKTRINAWKRTYGSSHWADSLEEIALQLNSTYTKAISAIPYEVVFNRKPNYYRTPVGARQVTVDDLPEEEIDDEADDAIVQQAAEEIVIEEQTEREREEEIEARRVFLDAEQERIDQQMIEDGNREWEEEQAERAREEEERRPSTPPNLLQDSGIDTIDPNLLSPQFQRITLAPADEAPQELDSIPTTQLRQRVHTSQKRATERSIRQYGKQRQVRVFEIGDKVSIAVPALDRASTDDKRIFGRVIGVYEEYNTYTILTKHGVLDRQYPTSEINPLPDNIELSIPDPPPSKKVSLHYCAAQESTAEKVPVHCNCRDQKTWCQTRRCACIKANAKCSIACHGGNNADSVPDCPNISTMRQRTQKGHRRRDTRDDSSDKRQRRDTAGRWAATKGVNEQGSRR